MAIATLNYLRDHPQAKDSLQGIAKWWVGEEPEVVEKALAFLLEEGVIVKRRHVYQLTSHETARDGFMVIEKSLRRLQRRR